MKAAAILDYGSGNVRSIKNALRKIGGEGRLTRDPQEINEAGALIIPGVGAFKHAMESLESYGLIEVIKDFAESGRPLLGICLGMQILMDESEEFGRSRGLGLIRGSVKRIPLKAEGNYRLPHIEWSGIYPPPEEGWTGTILSGLEPGTRFYFVHSYAVVPEREDVILSRTRYGNCEFVSSLKSGSLYGCQFHPERSGKGGLKILKNFMENGEVQPCRNRTRRPTTGYHRSSPTAEGASYPTSVPVQP
jgi:glutamine amidotransferase